MGGTEVEPGGELADGVDELLDLGLRICSGDLNSKADLALGHERVRSQSDVDPVLEQETTRRVDVLVPGERDFDDGETGAVGRVNPQPVEAFEDLCRLLPEVGTDLLSAGVVDVESREHGGERCRRRRA